MKEDFLKDFVDENRTSFEGEMPGKELLWQQISKETQVEKQPEFNFWKYASIAASFLALALFTLLMLPSETNSFQSSEVYAEFIDVQGFYESQIADQTTQLVNYDPNYLVLIKDFDDQYNQLVIDLEETGDPEVLEEMIDLYRAKLQVLEGLLDEITEKEQRHEITI